MPSYFEAGVCSIARHCLCIEVAFDVKKTTGNMYSFSV